MRISDWSSDVCSSDLLEKALQLLRVPYHLSGGTAFLDRGEVKDALSWLRLVANPEDDAAFLRAVQSPPRGVGATSLAKLAEIAQHAHLPLSRAAESIGLLKQLRSEEHTSELQSIMRISYAVFCLKKKIKTTRKRKHRR